MDINYNVGVQLKISEYAWESYIFYKRLKTLNLLLQKYFPGYDYQNTYYKDEETPLTIKCIKHEEFTILPKKVRKTNSTLCPECKKIEKNHTHKKIVYNQKTFIEKCEKENGDRFNYSKVEFKGFNYNIYPECHKHGTISIKNPATHLSYTSCPKCRGELKRYTTKTFIEKAKEIHGDAYDYTNSVYISSKEPISIFCNYCKNEYTHSQANWHLRGNGCNICNAGGFDGSKPAILYYISIDNGQAYKIGITNLSIKDRYSPSDFNRITIVKEWKYEFGTEAQRRELEIIQTFKSDKYNGHISMESCTHKEMFNRDILLLDTT